MTIEKMRQGLRPELEGRDEAYWDMGYMWRWVTRATFIDKYPRGLRSQAKEAPCSVPQISQLRSSASVRESWDTKIKQASPPAACKWIPSSLEISEGPRREVFPIIGVQKKKVSKQDGRSDDIRFNPPLPRHLAHDSSVNTAPDNPSWAAHSGVHQIAQIPEMKGITKLVVDRFGVQWCIVSLSHSKKRESLPGGDSQVLVAGLMVDIIPVVNRHSTRPVFTEDDAFKQDVGGPASRNKKRGIVKSWPSLLRPVLLDIGVKEPRRQHEGGGKKMIGPGGEIGTMTGDESGIWIWMRAAIEI
ncbi:hypothetical protein BJV74DRAFT_989718 [Russula compacta]|nr:hypothetical protein BJV74DRAFT_989718 [Russula compacta]